MPEIRAYRPSDLAALYEICLKTGDSGKDASHLYADPKIVGHVYAGPYGVLRPESALVLEDEDGVGGYVIGAAHTSAFEAELESEWWPTLRREYPVPPDLPRAELSWDQRMQRHIHRPPRTPPDIAGPYPAHLHIDLLPRFQGLGLGKAMIDRWVDLMRSLGASGVHLGVGSTNERAVRFYRAYGFHELVIAPGALIFALRL